MCIYSVKIINPAVFAGFFIHLRFCYYAICYVLVLFSCAERKVVYMSVPHFPTYRGTRTDCYQCGTKFANKEVIVVDEKSSTLAFCAHQDMRSQETTIYSKCIDTFRRETGVHPRILMRFRKIPA